jgi:hypothetical protein
MKPVGDIAARLRKLTGGLFMRASGHTNHRAARDVTLSLDRIPTSSVQ